MPATLYRRCFNAILHKRRLIFTYDGEPREVCPHVLGHSGGEEKLFAYQAAGSTSEGPIPPEGAWKCFFIAKICGLESKAGPWKTGSKHTQRHTCIDDVEIDVNPHAQQKFSWEKYLYKHKGRERGLASTKQSSRKRNPRTPPRTPKRLSIERLK